MLTRYGFGAIYIDDKEYKISPTFQNIDKLGTPKEIINKAIDFYSANKFIDLLMLSIEIIDCCANEPLPIEYTGEIAATKSGLKYKPSKLSGMATAEDLITLASHCLKYGVIGVTDNKSESEGEPIKEFDAYYYIGLACEHLRKSREEAADMTLTEFLMAWDIKFPEAKKKRDERLTKAEQQRLMDYQDELDRKAAQRRAAKESKQ